MIIGNQDASQTWQFLRKASVFAHMFLSVKAPTGLRRKAQGRAAFFAALPWVRNTFHHLP
jgi:hypothetical protein